MRLYLLIVYNPWGVGGWGLGGGGNKPCRTICTILGYGVVQPKDNWVDHLGRTSQFHTLVATHHPTLKKIKRRNWPIFQFFHTWKLFFFLIFLILLLEIKRYNNVPPLKKISNWILNFFIIINKREKKRKKKNIK